MKRISVARSLISCVIGVCLWHEALGDPPAGGAQAAKPNANVSQRSGAKVRTFQFDYKFRVKDLKPGASSKSAVRVWWPCPPSNRYQQVTQLSATTPDHVPIQNHSERQFGNRIDFIETWPPAEEAFDVGVSYRVERREVRRDDLAAAPSASEKLSDKERATYLRPNTMVPVSGKPLTLLDQVVLQKDKMARARQLYDIVDAHVAYKKVGTGWGQGDSNWVCDSGYGNCTDFHSLFMSLARSQGIPTRFEIGFSIPTGKREGRVDGYHCWAWFYLDGRGWIPVDISEADKHPEMKDYYFGDLTADRVMFTTGRDLVLEPKTAEGPRNFFIYPYAECDGKALPQDNIELQFAFKEIKSE